MIKTYKAIEITRPGQLFRNEQVSDAAGDSPGRTWRSTGDFRAICKAWIRLSS